MSNLEKFLNNKLPEDQDDLFMKQLTKLRMEGVKKGYEQKLKESYSVSKAHNRAKIIKKTLLVFGLVASIIALLYLSFGTNLIGGNKNDFSKDIAFYIQKNKIHNYDIVRGETSKDAYNEYQLGNYSNAINAWNNGEMNLQDSFYLALSYLYTDQYYEAETYFSLLNQKIGKADKFYPEHQLSWALTLALQEKKEIAQNLYESWPNDSWMAKEYSKIMNLEE